MAPWLRAPTTLPEDLSLIPSTHMAAYSRQHSQPPVCPVHLASLGPTYTQSTRRQADICIKSNRPFFFKEQYYHQLCQTTLLLTFQSKYKLLSLNNYLKIRSNQIKVIKSLKSVYNYITLSHLPIISLDKWQSFYLIHGSHSRVFHFHYHTNNHCPHLFNSEKFYCFSDMSLKSITAHAQSSTARSGQLREWLGEHDVVSLAYCQKLFNLCNKQLRPLLFCNIFLLHL